MFVTCIVERMDTSKHAKLQKKNQNELLEFIAMKVEPKVSDFIGVRISCTAVYCL